MRGGRINLKGLIALPSFSFLRMWEFRKCVANFLPVHVCYGTVPNDMVKHRHDSTTFCPKPALSENCGNRLLMQVSL